MANDQPANGAIETPHGTYWVQGLDRFAVGGQLHAEVAAAAAAHHAQFGQAPKAVIWDDAVLQFRLHNLSLTLHRVFVPPGDPLLAVALDSSARAAVRADVVAAEEPYATDCLGGLEWPSEVAHAPGLVRMIGWPDRAPLRSVEPPRPSGRAASISIVINYFNRAELTIGCLEHIRRQKVDARLEIILVNNRSDEEQRRKVKSAAQRLFATDAAVSIRHINYDNAFNHSRQCNTAAAAATGDVLLMLSNDCDLLDPAALQTLADWALEPGVGMVGPRLIGDDDVVHCAGIAIGPRSANAPGLRIHEAEVPYLSGLIRRSTGASFACAAIARTTWVTMGGADTKQFTIDYNDADFSLRLLRKGYHNLYIGTVSVRHQPGMADVRTRESAEELHGKLAARHRLDTLPRLNPYTMQIKVYPEFGDRCAQAVCDYARTFRKARDLYRADGEVPRLALRAAFDALVAAAHTPPEARARGSRAHPIDAAARLVCATLIVSDGKTPERYRKSFLLLQAAFDHLHALAVRPVTPINLAGPAPAMARRAAQPVRKAGEDADPDPKREYLSHSDPDFSNAVHRILVFADGFGASPQILFLQGLASARSAGRAAVRIFSEDDLLRLRSPNDPERRAAYLARTMDYTRPTAIVFSRMADQDSYRAIVAAAAKLDVPLVCHIDDDFFALPAVIGVDRYREARHPRRIHGLAQIAARSDLILVSTPVLARRMAEQFGASRIGLCEMARGGSPFRRDPREGPLVIGYHGSATHNRDLEMIAPALERIAREHPTLRIEIVGSVARRSAAAALGEHVVRRSELEQDYAAFRAGMRGWGWDIGLAPLGAHPFNAAKTPIKWTEYAQAGIPTLASRTEPYLELGRRGALMLASPDEWHGRLTELIARPERRGALVDTSNHILASWRGWEVMEERLLGLLGRAAARHDPIGRIAA